MFQEKQETQSFVQENEVFEPGFVSQEEGLKEGPEEEPGFVSKEEKEETPN